MKSLDSDAAIVQAIARVDELHAYQEISSMIYRNERAFDFGSPEEWADCFLPDGSFSCAYPDGRVETYTGHAELAKFAADFEPSSPYVRHFVVAPDIQIDPSKLTATATAIQGVFDARPPDSGPFLRLIGRYS